MENFLMDLLLAFLMGGFICLIAQILLDKTKLTPAKILVFYVSLGVLLYATGIYEFIYNIFGCGISTPLIGFGANIGRGVSEAVEKDGFKGILSGGITAAAEGITLSLFLGLVCSLLFGTKQRRM